MHDDFVTRLVLIANKHAAHYWELRGGILNSC